MKRRARFALLFATVLATVLVAAGCGGRPTVDAPATVLLVGDSITADAAATVTPELSRAHWSVHIDGQGGSAISGGPAVPSWPARIADLVRQWKPTVVVV